VEVWRRYLLVDSSVWFLLPLYVQILLSWNTATVASQSPWRAVLRRTCQQTVLWLPTPPDADDSSSGRFCPPAHPPANPSARRCVVRPPACLPGTVECTAEPVRFH
jgi:hypothetical protein